MHPAPAFAMLERGDLRLALSAPGGGAGGGQAMPDGTRPDAWRLEPVQLEVDDLAAIGSSACAAGAHVPQRHRGRRRRQPDPARGSVGQPGRAVPADARGGADVIDLTLGETSLTGDGAPRPLRAPAANQTADGARRAARRTAGHGHPSLRRAHRALPAIAELIEELLATRHDDFTKLNYLPQHGELQQARGRLIMSEERAEHVAARKALGRLMSGDPLAEISLGLDEQLARSVPAPPSVLELPEAAYGITADLTAAQLFDPAAKADAADGRHRARPGRRDAVSAQAAREARMRDHDVVAEVIAGFERLSAGRRPGGRRPQAACRPVRRVRPRADLRPGRRLCRSVGDDRTGRVLVRGPGRLGRGDPGGPGRGGGGHGAAGCALLRAAVLEAIRLYPPSWLIGRFATTETTLGGSPSPPARSCSWRPT